MPNPYRMPALAQDPLQGILEQASPEQIAQILGVGGQDDQQRLLEHQMAQADALRSSPMEQHTTGRGALLGGIGHALNQVTGFLGQNAAEKEMRGLMGKRQSALSSLVDLLRSHP
jgi:hypothetical protein